jgi:hypothetical protein
MLLRHKRIGVIVGLFDAAQLFGLAAFLAWDAFTSEHQSKGEDSAIVGCFFIALLVMAVVLVEVSFLAARTRRTAVDVLTVVVAFSAAMKLSL